MNQLANITNTEEWVRVVGKGMVTIPKSWREELGLQPGKVVKAKKIGSKVVLEAEAKEAPYRIYTSKEIKQFLKNDRLPKSLKRRIDRKLATLKTS